MLGASSATAMRRSASADRLPAAGAAMPLPQHQVVGHAGRQQRRLALRFRGYRLGLPVPSEMWGAAALAVRMVQPELPRGASVIAQAFSAASTAGVPPPPPSSQVSEDHPKALAEALEWRPALAQTEELSCLLLPWAICAVVYACTRPAGLQPLYAVGMALLYAAMLLTMRMFLIERRYKTVQRTERELAAADSQFVEVDGIDLHYKRRTPAGMPGGGGGGGSGMVVHCLHGFGASSYSWSFVQQELADALHAVVTAHDMPGFGLTQRPRNPRYYTLHFNGDAARHILDAELAAQQPPQPQEWRSHPITTASSSSSSLGSNESPVATSFVVDIDSGSEDGQQQAEGQQRQAEKQQRGEGQQQAKRVLIGHSMGGAAVAEGVISNPEGVAALVLVAPAIVALWAGPPEEAAGDPVAKGLAVVEELISAEDAPGEVPPIQPAASSTTQFMARSDSGSSSSSNGAVGGSSGSGSRNGAGANGSSTGGAGGGPGLGARAQRAARTAAAVVKATLLLFVRVLLAAATPLLVLVLRRLVRARRFWERGLASAWHDSRRGVTREYVDNYRSGQLVRGWEGGILRFLAARFAEKHGFWGSIKNAMQGDGHLTQAERLAAAVKRHNIRVLIVHGSSDALVPAANSRRLAALLPNAELVVFDGCGHMPQEESPERFVQTVQQFVQQSLG